MTYPWQTSTAAWWNANKDRPEFLGAWRETLIRAAEATHCRHVVLRGSDGVAVMGFVMEAAQ